MKNDPKKFDPKHKHKLDSPERRKILPPYKILNDAGIQKGDILADIGCGIGYFSIPAAKIIGTTGKVIAIDPSEEMLEELIKRIKKEKIQNIEVKKTLPYKFPIKDESVSFVFISNVLHEIDNKSKFLKEVYRILKLQGKLCIIEYIKKDTGTNPPVKARLSVKQVQNYLEKFKFIFEKFSLISDTFVMYLAHK